MGFFGQAIPERALSQPICGSYYEILQSLIARPGSETPEILTPPLLTVALLRGAVGGPLCSLLLALGLEGLP